MNLECSHIMLNVSNLKLARTFYIDQLEMPLIEEYSAMFAFHAGNVRFTVVGGGSQPKRLPCQPRHIRPNLQRSGSCRRGRVANV